MYGKISKFRYIFCISFATVAFASFAYKLIDWQIVNGENLKIRASCNNTYSVSIRASRGEILDVNGIDFAVNDVVYQISFDRFKYKEENINETISFLLDLFEKRNEKFIDDLPILLLNDETYLFLEDQPNENKIKSEINRLKSPEILNLNDYATAKDCILKLIEKYKISPSYSDKKKRDITSVRYGMTKKGFDNSIVKSYAFAKDISREMITIISELSNKMPILKITNEPKRSCKNGTLAPHIIGCVGKLDKEEYDARKNRGYWLDDIIGKEGIERVYESELRGKDGKKIVETDKNGEIILQSINKEVEHGHTVFLTIDAKLQKVLGESLQKNVLATNYKKSGAAVVMDLRDFSILAAATFPSYDLNKYNTENDYYNNLHNHNDDKTNPLINRAFNDLTEPGSSFKVLTALAALQENKITTDSTVHCSGGWVAPGTNHRTRCMGHHGNVSLRRAIYASCNSYFLNTGYNLTGEKITHYAKKFGLGVKTGIELDEKSGRLPDPEVAKEIGGEWSRVQDAEAGMGQSINFYSPVQLATYVATVANNGKRYKTHLIRKIMDYQRKNVLFENNPEKPELIEEANIKGEYFDFVKEAMRQGSLIGTAQTPFSRYDISVASKTGTAENPSGHDHKIYVGFAPYDKDKKPEIAFAVVIKEGGTYDNGYKMVARDVCDYYFKGVGKDANLE